MSDIFDILKGSPTDDDYNKKGVIVQGMTGAYGSLHTRNMISYGTRIVAGVTPGKGGGNHEGIPIYNTMAEAIKATSAAISVMFVPARFFKDAAIEALEAGIRLLVAIPEHVPVRDTMAVLELARRKGAIMVGPNTPGVMIPELIKIGIMPPTPFKAGNIAVISKSGTLLYEISDALSSAGFGQCITLGIGGDPINGTRLVDAFEMVRDLPGLEGLVIVGEIGGDAEEVLAQTIMQQNFTKPAVAYIAGRAAPKEKRMGHAGAIVMGTYGSAESKVGMFDKANIPVAKRPAEVPILLSDKMGI